MKRIEKKIDMLLKHFGLMREDCFSESNKMSYSFVKAVYTEDFSQYEGMSTRDILKVKGIEYNKAEANYLSVVAREQGFKRKRIGKNGNSLWFKSSR